MREKKKELTKVPTAGTTPFARPARKITDWLTLRFVLAVISISTLAAFIFRAAGAWDWLVAALLTAITFFLLTLRREADLQLHYGADGLLEKLSDSLPGMVYQCRLYPTGRCALTYSNDAIRWIYEKEVGELSYDCSSILELVHPEDRDHVWKSLAESMLRLTPWKGEYRVILPQQGIRWRFAQASVERLIDGSTLWHGFIADVTARKEADERLLLAEQREAAALRSAHLAEQKKLELLSRLNESLREQATHDHLTGVFLRRYFDRRYPEIFERSRAKRPLTLVFCDIDYFKAYNDTFGHLAGDQCLKAVARALSAQINRKGQILARYGGEEFVAILPGLGSARAAAFAEELRASVQTLALKPAKGGAAVTISVGVACVDILSDELTPAAFLHSADLALYQAKRAGRNCIHLHNLNITPAIAPPAAALADRSHPSSASAEREKKRSQKIKLSA